MRVVVGNIDIQWSTLPLVAIATTIDAVNQIDESA
jgi:hypothetical protein